MKKMTLQDLKDFFMSQSDPMNKWKYSRSTTSAIKIPKVWYACSLWVVKK